VIDSRKVEIYDLIAIKTGWRDGTIEEIILWFTFGSLLLLLLHFYFTFAVHSLCNRFKDIKSMEQKFHSNSKIIDSKGTRERFQSDCKAIATLLQND
jgi:uncharacterized protein YrrD